MTQNGCRLIINEQARSPIAEAYRTLRTNLQFSKVNGELKVIIFTSAGPGEGKSTTVANTAVTLANLGKKVIVLDCDLRRPIQYKIFGRRNIGLTNVLVEDLPVAEHIQKTEIENLCLLASGPIPPNPSELLGNAAMQKIMDYLKNQADYLLIDTPPALTVTDVCVLAAKADGVVLVFDANSIKPQVAQQAKAILLKAQANLLGVVLNRVAIELEHYYYYYYNSDKESETN